MQFTEFTQLDKLKQHQYNEAPVLKIETHPQNKKIVQQLNELITSIHEINHSRSLSTSILVSEAQQPPLMAFCQSQYQPLQESIADEVIFTPTPISVPSIRKSNIFTSTRSNQDKTAISVSKKDNGVKVFYFGQNVHKFVEYGNLTTIDSLINRAVTLYAADYTLDQNYIVSKDTKNYQMRFVQQQGSFKPDMTVEPVARERVLMDSLFQVLVLVSKNTFSKQKPTSNKSNITKSSEKATMMENESNQVILHIFNQANMHISTLILSKNDTLNKAIQFLQAQLKQKIVLAQNLQDQIYLPADVDVVNLGTFKLYAKKKRFLDEPEAQQVALKMQSTAPKDLSSTILPPIGITQASRYEQFQVIKINVRGVEQPRIIGLDQTKLYNYDVEVRKKNKQASFLSVFIGNNIFTGTKKPQRLISQIRALHELPDLNFEIVLPQKKIFFRAQSSQQKQKIIRKLKFLIDYNKQFNRLII